MANEAREAAIKTAIQKFKDENLENPNSALPTDIRVILTDGIRLGYDAHESAIRTAAEALMGKVEEVSKATRWCFAFCQMHGMPYEGPHYADELAALKAALAKEKE